MNYKCDIILLSYENPSLLKKCVESVLNDTEVPARLIIVDNGSRDRKVAEYLQSVKGSKTVSVEKVLSPDNAGFAAGMNKGLKLSNAPYVCLLNNDCVVTPGWLGEMIEIASSSGEIGLVNPQSNTFGSRPDGSASVREHAELLRYRESSYTELGHAIGFACLIKREVINRVGFLDEGYAGVCYEDTDYSLRAGKAGYISVMSERAYVFHMEQASRKGLKGKEKIYERNRRRFEKKWGRLLRVFFLEDRNSDDKVYMDYSMALKPMARQRMIVEAWYAGLAPEEEVLGEMRRKGIVRHADVGLRSVASGTYYLRALFRILFKKKKYDVLILPERAPLKLFAFFRAVHKARILVRGKGYEVRSSDNMLFDLREPFSMAEWLREKK
ncbi:MAG: glycosyltransferase [Candidatus Omnitrophica bacterium]|nr:glycosyltransferase [Candidatus Omnitrophota bacterium]